MLSTRIRHLSTDCSHCLCNVWTCTYHSEHQTSHCWCKNQNGELPLYSQNWLLKYYFIFKTPLIFLHSSSLFSLGGTHFSFSFFFVKVFLFFSLGGIYLGFNLGGFFIVWHRPTMTLSPVRNKSIFSHVPHPVGYLTMDLVMRKVQNFYLVCSCEDVWELNYVASR